MAATKTLQTILNEGYTFPAVVPDDVQGLIADWFKDRTVADDDHFTEWFDRLLIMDIPRYNQLLRIEPGIAEYDWLVSTYRERQIKESGSGKTSGESSGSKNATTTPTRTEKTTYAGTDARYTANNLIDHKTGTEKDERSESRTTSSEGSTSGTATNTSSGDNRTMARSLPMSQSYGTDTAAASDRNSGLPAALDWSTGTSAQETDSVTNTSESTSGSTSDSGTDKSSGDDTRTYNVQDSHTGTVDITTNYGQEITRTITGGDTDAETSSGTTSGETSHENTTREIFTGRDSEIAQIMERAKLFIMSTNAWVWLSSEIEKVFLGVYDI